MLTWNKYINKNRTEGDCQLVTAVNAYYYLTGKIVSKEGYEKLIDLTKCRHGSAIFIEKAWKVLEIKPIWSGKSLYDLLFYSKNWRPKKGCVKVKTEKIPLPMEVNIWHRKTGFHSVLIVDHCLKSKCFRITNFRHETTSDGWFFQEELYQFERESQNRIYRLFGLKEDKKLKKLT